ncbi:TPA: aromatic amino acid aminotransferase [Candidatus Latescibacteria bacterium]|nr:aromatic amino acid aminotransferase [Candidatus Latescibacterota bacterium]
MFETLEQAPPDPILGLTTAFNADPNPNKINLGVGVYKDDDGNTPVFKSVKTAEERILQVEDTKNYLTIDGDPGYGAAVQQLLFGADHEILSSERAVTVQTPGGTGALRVAGDFISKLFPDATLWLSDPTWANHPKVFDAAGVPIKTYPYYDSEANVLDFGALIEALNQVPEGDVVLLHGCCHNPTGMDPTPEQWAEIADVVQSRKFIPLVDFAYQGLGDGLDADGKGMHTLAATGCEMFVASSFSKNFGLYRERIGALTLVTSDKDAAAVAKSHVLIMIRTNYSNPPAHGSSIVTTVLNDLELRAGWDAEVKEMRDRINGVRRKLVDALETKGVKRDFSFIARQRGMFSFSGLTPEQVDELREEYSIYVVKTGGRINVAGIRDENIDYLCDSIATVLNA